MRNKQYYCKIFHIVSEYYRLYTNPRDYSNKKKFLKKIVKRKKND